VEVHQILVFRSEFVLGHILERSIEIVHTVEEVLRELLEGEVFVSLDLALGLFLEVAVFGDLTF
jgi:hypothetical protein